MKQIFNPKSALIFSTITENLNVAGQTQKIGVGMLNALESLLNTQGTQDWIVDKTKTFVPLLALGLSGSESIFTSVAISPSQENFSPLTPFETLLLGLVLLHILVLQLYGFIPFDLNKVLKGEYTPSFGNGFATFMKIRKKRSVAGFGKDFHSLVDKLFDILILVDKHECVLKSLCEVQKHSQYFYRPPSSLNGILFALNYTITNDMRKSTAGVSISKIKLGNSIITGQMSKDLSSKDCELSYNGCPLSTLDIMSYIDTINLDEFT